MEYHIYKGQKKLKYGYTTGTCAAVAAGEAVRKLLFGMRQEKVSVILKDSMRFEIEVADAPEEFAQSGWMGCAVKKNSGDDPDVTDGVLVCVYVHAESDGMKQPGQTEKDGQTESSRQPEVSGSRRFCEKVTDEAGHVVRTFFLSGGEGVGIVTGPGLSQEPGYPAINAGPRAQIFAAAEAVCLEAGFTGCLEMEIVIPEGRRLAEKTFNPRLGIREGLSVLGTTGVLEPMSEKALVDTIAVEMKAALYGGKRIVLMTPGNYGQDYVREHWGLSLERAVKCSNYIGEAVDLAVNLGAEGILLAGDIGKLVKLAAGIFRTHSREADGRMEILGVHAAMAGADKTTVCRIMACAATAEALDILQENGLFQAVLQTVLEKIQEHLQARAENLRIGVGLFAGKYGMLGCAGEAEALVRAYQKQEEKGR